MSDKTNWAEVDKRIRARRASWTNEEQKALDAGLNKLPDLAEELEIIDIPQPALGTPAEEEEAEAGAEVPAAEGS